MEIITKVLDEFIDLPPNYFVLDIETTGLSPKYCKVILIGIMYNLDNKTIIKQFFAQTQDDEFKLLLEFINEIKNYENHITFNGLAFDIPFLNSRFNKYNLDYTLSKDKDIDILKLIKPFKDKLSLHDCKLKTLEKYLGIYRKDAISGRESVELYNEYINSNCKEIKDKILLHNYEDIYYLGKVFKIKNILYDKLDTITINFNNLDVTLVPLNFKIQHSQIITKYSILSESIIPINIYNDKYSIISDDKYIYFKLLYNKGYDSNNNSILFYKMSKVIPLKFNDKFLENNIYSLCNYLIQKELKSL